MLARCRVAVQREWKPEVERSSRGPKAYHQQARENCEESADEKETKKVWLAMEERKIAKQRASEAREESII